jgi:hypothetical protein
MARQVDIQRRHFEFIAEVIRNLAPEGNSRKAVAEAFGNALWQTNPQYVRTRFLTACEPKNK